MRTKSLPSSRVICAALFFLSMSGVQFASAQVVPSVPVPPSRRAADPGPPRATDGIAKVLGFDFVEKTPGTMTISAIDLKGPAGELDLRQGDVLHSISDMPVTSREDVARVLGKMNPGERLTLRVLRDRRPVSLVLVTAARLVAPGEPTPAAVPAVPPPVARRDRVGILGMFVEQRKNAVVVTEVSPNTPAAKAGLKSGDILLLIGDRKVALLNDDLIGFTTTLVGRKHADEIKIIVLRENEEVALAVGLPEPTSPGPLTVAPAIEFTSVLCMAVRDMNGRIVVTKVTSKSPAYAAGIRSGDVVVMLGSRSVGAVADLVQGTALLKRGDRVELGVLRGEKVVTVAFTVTPCEADLVPVVATGRPVSLDELSAQVKSMRAQIEVLRDAVDVLSDTIEEMRRR